MNGRIYLDNNASTAIDPCIIPAITQHLESIQGNPSSLHAPGLEARKVLNKSREFISQFLQVKPSEIIFTSSGTEGLNMVLRGIGALHPRGHIVTSSVEHSAVYATVKYLESIGMKATILTPAYGER